MAVQYLVTVTNERETFHWVFSNKEDARRLLDLAEEYGGDHYWDVQPLVLDYPAEAAFATFKDIIEEE